jgi:hypothetical protein
MSDIVLGGLSGLRGWLRFARRGNWQGRMVMSDDSAPAGIFTASILSGATITGFAIRSAAPYLQGQIELVGGHGNVNPDVTIDARDYRYASFSQIATEIIEDAGEIVAVDSTGTSELVGIDQQLIAWTRFTGSWISELERLIATRNDPNGINDGTTWKVRPADGQIEVRPLVTQPTSPQLVLLADLVTEHRQIYALQDETQGLAIMPGDQYTSPTDATVTITVDTVEYTFEPDQTRVEVLYGPSPQPLDRLTATTQAIHDVCQARYRQNNVDPLGYYAGTIVGIRGNGDVDILADDIRIGFVNDFPLYSGLPGWQLTPVPRSATFAGARVLFGWVGGDKSKKVALAWGASPANSLDTATIQARTLVQWQVPTFSVIGNSEVHQGDDRTEHDVGIGPALAPTDAVIGIGAGPAGEITGLSGTDCGFTIQITADTSSSPPPTGGDVAYVTPKRSFGAAVNGANVAGADSASAALGPYVSATADRITIGVSKGMTKAQIYNYSVIIKV